MAMHRNSSIGNNNSPPFSGGATSDSYIQLNVGGRIFCTTRSTLLKDPHSLFARLLHYDGLGLQDQNGNIFIDRNPRCFEHILDYLRDGKFFCRTEELACLLHEANYYHLAGLVKAVQNEADKREMERYALQSGNLKRSSSPTISLASTTTGTPTSASMVSMLAQSNSVVELMRRIDDSCRRVWGFCSQITVGQDGYLLVKRY